MDDARQAAALAMSRRRHPQKRSWPASSTFIPNHAGIRGVVISAPDARKQPTDRRCRMRDTCVDTNSACSEDKTCRALRADTDRSPGAASRRRRGRRRAGDGRGGRAFRGDHQDRICTTCFGKPAAGGRSIPSSWCRPWRSVRPSDVGTTPVQISRAIRNRWSTACHLISQTVLPHRIGPRPRIGRAAPSCLVRFSP